MKRIILFIFCHSIFIPCGFASMDSDAFLQKLQKLEAQVEILEHEVAILKKKLDIEKNHNSHDAQKQKHLSDSPESSNENINEKAASQKASKDGESENQNSQSHMPTSNFDRKVSQKAKYDLALAALKDKEYESSKKQFAEFISNYPESPKLAQAYFWYAETFYGQKEYKTAALHYLKCYQNFPKSKKAPDALLKLAICLDADDRKVESCKVIKKIEGEFPSLPANTRKALNDLKVRINCI